LAQKKIKFEAAAAVITQKKKLESVVSQKPVLTLEGCPPPQQDFGNWLKHQKANWRGIRKQFKSEKGIVKK
jgi:hypothetical protein